ncbi:MAG TPA: sigma-70 family RNA polymerase sigma factor [Anaerolineae bacterium]|nr:sigma-70 family RNA polymerase sigma factor [Anaerolineae bacterium]
MRILDERSPGSGAAAMGQVDVTDESLLARAAAGDASALEALYDRYAPVVMGLALKMIGDRAAAEEIVQETFWRVWRNADAFRAQRGTATSWLFGIARNLIIDLCRRRKVRPQPAQSEDEARRVESAADPDSDVPESAWTSIKRRQVRAAMAQLPAAQRRVIELAYFGGMTRQEIAQAIGEPLGTVHTRARLALQKLRESLQAQGFED